MCPIISLAQPMITTSRRAIDVRSDQIAKTGRADFVNFDFAPPGRGFKTIPAFVFAQHVLFHSQEIKAIWKMKNDYVLYVFRGLITKFSQS